MARIVSGFQTQGGDWDGGAILRGFQKAQQSKSGMDQGEQIRLMLSIQNALQDQQRFEAEQEERKSDRAREREAQNQVGKAGRLQQLAQKADAGLMKPGDKLMQRIIGARSRLQDPKALALFDDSVSQLVKSQQMAKKRKAAEEAIGMAEKDTDIFPPEMIQGARQTLEAGGDLDAVVKMLGEHRVKTATSQQIVGENEEVLAQIADMIRTAPPGFGKEQAQIIYNSVANSNSLKSVKGSGARALRSVQEALLGPRSEFGKGEEDPFTDPGNLKSAYKMLLDQGLSDEDITTEAMQAQIARFYPGKKPPPSMSARPAPGLPGMTVGQRNEEMMKEPTMGFGGPNVPPFVPSGPQAHATRKRGKVTPEGIKKVAVDAVKSGARGADLVKLLRDQGADPNDPATLAQIEAALRGGE